MVTADVYKATDDIGKMFESRNISGIALAAGLAGVGFAIAASVGSTVLDFAGLDDVGFVPSTVAAIGAGIGAMLLVRFLGVGVGGALAVGVLGWVGLLLIATVAGTIEPINAVNRAIGVGGGQTRVVRRASQGPRSEAPVRTLPSVTGQVDRPPGKLGV